MEVHQSEGWKPIKVNPSFQLSWAQTPLQDTCPQPQLLPTELLPLGRHKDNLVSPPLLWLHSSPCSWSFALLLLCLLSVRGINQPFHRITKVGKDLYSFLVSHPHRATNHVPQCHFPTGGHMWTPWGCPGVCRVQHPQSDADRETEELGARRDWFFISSIQFNKEPALK